jgi:hypothetical protein
VILDPSDQIEPRHANFGEQVAESFWIVVAQPLVAQVCSICQGGGLLLFRGSRKMVAV